MTMVIREMGEIAPPARCHTTNGVHLRARQARRLARQAPPADGEGHIQPEKTPEHIAAQMFILTASWWTSGTSIYQRCHCLIGSEKVGNLLTFV